MKWNIESLQTEIDELRQFYHEHGRLPPKPEMTLEQEAKYDKIIDAITSGEHNVRRMQ
jgi:hypothetical protein